MDPFQTVSGVGCNLESLALGQRQPRRNTSFSMVCHVTMKRQSEIADLPK